MRCKNSKSFEKCGYTWLFSMSLRLLLTKINVFTLEMLNSCFRNITKVVIVSNLSEKSVFEILNLKLVSINESFEFWPQLRISTGLMTFWGGKFQWNSRNRTETKHNTGLWSGKMCSSKLSNDFVCSPPFIWALNLFEHIKCIGWTTNKCLLLFLCSFYLIYSNDAFSKCSLGSKGVELK